MIGVTGSNGKSTTAAMIAAILEHNRRHTFLGGNIGRSLLGDLDYMRPDSWSVLEISSFQLAWLSLDCPLPEIGVLTNFTPNHLDWHGTLMDYASAKRRMFCGSQAARMAILGSPRAGFENGGGGAAARSACSRHRSITEIPQFAHHREAQPSQCGLRGGGSP